MDLEELKERGNQLRLEHRRELQSLRSEFEPLLENLHERHENRKDHSIYQKLMEPSVRVQQQSEEKKDDGFEDISEQMEEQEQEPEFTPFVRKIQSQLCGALHQVEVNQRQIKLAQRSNKRVIVNLSTEIEAQKAITKARCEHFEGEKKEIESSNQVMFDMLEKDAVDQEEVITSLRLQLGMDPTPNSQRKNFRQRQRRRIQRLSGGLRNLGSNLGRRVRETPRNIRDSKVWKDLMAVEEGGDDFDASERRRGIMRRLRRSSRNVNGEGTDSPSSDAQQQKQTKNKFHSSKVEKLSLDDIEGNNRLGLVGRIRRSRQMRQGSNSEIQDYLDNRVDLSKPLQPQRQPLQGVRRRASNLRRGLFRRQNSGKSLDSEDSNASTEPPTPPANEKALHPMDDDMFAQEIYALSI